MSHLALAPWGHSYEVAPGVWTREDEPFLNWRVEKFQEIFARQQLNLPGLRILDLACLDGLFCVEYGKKGAVTHGVDIRPENIARAKFGAAANHLEKVTFEINDVLNLSKATHGAYDVVLCCGLFYHLTASDCVKLLRIMREMTNAVCILDTHISFADHVIEGGYPLSEAFKATVEGESYEGRAYVEFDESTPMDVRMSMPSSSVYNDKSFWFTRPSLYKAIETTGFKVVEEVFGDPRIPVEQQSRPVFVLR
jgi:hypothetical protein